MRGFEQFRAYFGHVFSQIKQFVVLPWKKVGLATSNHPINEWNKFKLVFLDKT